jgi:hypothetical protein
MRYRVIAIIVLLVGWSVGTYAWWSSERITPAPGDPAFPRPFPYPDPWLMAWNDYYERHDPSKGRGIKLHGEFPRVAENVRAIAYGGAALGTVGVVMLLLPLVRKGMNARRRGFDVVLPKQGDAS